MAEAGGLAPPDLLRLSVFKTDARTILSDASKVLVHSSGIEPLSTDYRSVARPLCYECIVFMAADPGSAPGILASKASVILFH